MGKNQQANLILTQSCICLSLANGKTWRCDFASIRHPSTHSSYTPERNTATSQGSLPQLTNTIQAEPAGISELTSLSRPVSMISEIKYLLK
jgi:hypothetical protein